jgi:ribosomal protein S15P/S13E
MYLVASSRGVVNPIAMTNIGKTVQYASSLLVHNVNNKYSKNMKSTKLQRDILRWEYENETKDMYSPPSPIEWLENKLIELRKHAVVGQSEQLKCEHKGRRTATELVEYCEDCKKILFHP